MRLVLVQIFDLTSGNLKKKFPRDFANFKGTIFKIKVFK